jgi:aryl-alcohol dehydrogenase
MKVLAATSNGPRSLFEIRELNLENPRADEILVRIAGVGLCHTDIVFKDAMPHYPRPAVFGHEGSGIVEAVGSGVKAVIPGDRVILTFRSCGACDRCARGDPAYCRTMPQLNYTGAREDGSTALCCEAGAVASNFFGQSSFATHALAHETNAVKVDANLPIELLGPLGCGVQTGVGAVLRSLKVGKGDSLLIVGGGAVGLSAVMGAVIAGCSKIILSEPLSPRRSLATELGATHTVDPSSEDIQTYIRSILPEGVDFALDTSGNASAIGAAAASLGSMGVLGLVGVAPSGTMVPCEVNKQMTFGQSIRGIIEGDSDPRTFIPELLGYVQSGKLPLERLVQTFPLSRINEAVEAQHRGDCVKAVLLPGG